MRSSGKEAAPVSEKLELTLTVSIDRTGLERKLNQPIEKETAFFILGMVGAQLASRFGEDYCAVELSAATGLSPDFLRSMNTFARKHQQALTRYGANGEVVVDDPDMVEVFQLLHAADAIKVGKAWRLVRKEPDPDEESAH
jgi:hypothetical protein